MTNMGLCIHVPLFQVPGNENIVIAVLLCCSNNISNKFIGLPLHVHNSAPFQKNYFLPEGGLVPSLEPSIAERDPFSDPVSLDVSVSGFDEYVRLPYVNIYWDNHNREVKAYVIKVIYPPKPYLYHLGGTTTDAYGRMRVLRTMGLKSFITEEKSVHLALG
jgi:hypothetical protein